MGSLSKCTKTNRKNEETRNFRKIKTKAKGTNLKGLTHQKNKVHIKLRRKEQEAKAKQVALP
jgi:hypothetical protein